MDPNRDSEAHHKIDAHEKVCAERYGNLWEAVKRIEQGMADDRSIRSALDAATHIRFNAISARMWTVMFSALGGTVVGCAGLVFYLLTRGKL